MECSFTALISLLLIIIIVLTTCYLDDLFTSPAAVADAVVAVVVVVVSPRPRATRTARSAEVSARWRRMRTPTWAASAVVAAVAVDTRRVHQ